MEIPYEACRICKAYEFYNLPLQDHSETYNEDLVYRISLTLKKEGVVKVITSLLFISLILGILIKVYKRQKTLQVRWLFELFFSLLNIAWIASCVVLLSKCTWLVIYQRDDISEIIKLFPWYICVISSCCIIDIAENCTYRLTKITDGKLVWIDPKDIDKKDILKLLYMKESQITSM